MSRRKRSRQPTACIEPVEPFADSEQAWFWFARCQRLRHEGARFERSTGSVRRPCDPDDIYRVVARLYRGKRLRKHHVAVLVRYGELERAPDPRVPAEQVPDRAWRDAHDRIGPVLEAKGIVESNAISDRYAASFDGRSPCRP